MIQIKTLGNTPFEQIHSAFAKAFEDYIEPFDLTQDQLKHMVERRACDFELSFGAFHNDELIGFTLNGIDNWNGRLTAYDTGTGIIKDFRKQGIATRMFNESLPILRQNKITQYLLEVIKTNTSAVHLYKKAGFKIIREFDYYVKTREPKDDLAKIKFVQIEGIRFNGEYVIQQIEEPAWKIFENFWDFYPSWQNSIDSIKRKFKCFNFLGIYHQYNLIGYGIIEKHTGDIPQFAISPQHRRKGLGKILYYSLLECTASNQIKFINPDADNKPFKIFAKNLGLPPGLGQYEMLMKF